MYLFLLLHGVSLLRVLVSLHVVLNAKIYPFFLSKGHVMLAVKECMVLVQDFLAFQLEFLHVFPALLGYLIIGLLLFLVQVNLPLWEEFVFVFYLHVTELQEFSLMLCAKGLDLPQEFKLS